MFGALAVASTTFTSCKDYDDDINDIKGQIEVTNADLEAEISRLEKALATTDAALEQAKLNLQQAIKDATNDAKGYADIQAEQAKNAALATARQEIQDAIDALKNGEILTAQTKANDAYNLAQQAHTLAKANETKIGELTTKLNETNTKLSALTSRVDEVEVLASTNKTKIESLESQLNALKEANELAHSALSAKDDELKGLIDANLAKINTILNESIPALKQDIQTNKDNIAANARKISALEDEVKKVNGYLFSNLNNLITGLIFQDQKLEIVQAKVNDAGGNNFNYTGDASLNHVDITNTLHFPYIGAINETKLTVGHWNVERVAGPVYYTINPTEVNFTDQANINIENSLGNPPTGITIGAPKTSTRLSAITRATGNTKNGLYQSKVENSRTDLADAHPGFKTYAADGTPNADGNSFALYTTYKQYDENGTLTDKKVYSQYALNITVDDAGLQTNPQIIPIGADATRSTWASVDARFTAQYGDPMKGKFKLTPVNTEFGISDPADHKVYQKYVDIVEIYDARRVAQVNTATFKKLDQLKKALRDANPEVLNTIFEEDNENFDNIVINCPDNTTLSNGTEYNFIGTTVKFRYYIQNYNGTIYSKDIMVMFAKELFKEAEVTIEHTPYQAGVNTTKQSGVSTNNDQSKMDFRNEANCITVAASNKLWTENTSEIKFTTVTSGLNLKSIKFYGNLWSLVATADMTGTKTITGLTLSQMQSIKDLVIEYDPADLIPEDKTYELKMESFDQNGNYIATLPIKFTMKYPWHHAELIKPNPAYFSPYDRNMTAADIKTDKTLTAWANEHVTVDAVNHIYDASYNLIAAFNQPWYNTDGCVLRFDYTNKAGDKDGVWPCNDKSTYTTVGGSNKAFKPVSTVPFWYTSSSSDYKMEVPSAAVKFQSEHNYIMQVQVMCYGVQSLWWRPYEFNMKYKSAIAYATATADALTDGSPELFKWSKEFYTVGYPEKELTITDADITTDDPSTSVTDDITYFGTSRDPRIFKTEVELVEKQFGSLFDVVAITNQGIHIKTSENVPGGVASITSDKIKFNLYVTDFYGNTITRPFYVKVNQNM